MPLVCHLSAQNTIIPLHSSVLKELRSALVYRRINMEEREQKALRKRTLVLSAANSVSYEADASKDEKRPEVGLNCLCSCMLAA